MAFEVNRMDQYQQPILLNGPVTQPGVPNRCELGLGELASQAPSELSRAPTPKASPQERCCSLGGFLAIVIVLQQRLVKSTLELSVLIAEILEHHADMKKTHWQKA
jgi:hypothetical protein